MTLLWILLGIAAFLALAVTVTAWVCYRIAFYASRKEPKVKEEYPLPVGDIYDPYRDIMVHWIKEVRKLPYDDIAIRSFDGLTLRGKYYEYAPGAPIELMFHGYRGSAERDLSGGIERCFRVRRSALIVDQRGCGRSGGHTITFGILERRDCLSWLDYMQTRFGKDTTINLTGSSMGASTVLMAAGEPLPGNVVGVLADCGFTSAEDIIKKVIRSDMKLPPDLAYPFVQLGAKLFGHFDLDETSALAAMQRCRLPVIFFHGDTDDFVPHEMSVRNHAACGAKKMLCTIPGAGHGLCYPVAPKVYLQALRDFFDPLL